MKIKAKILMMIALLGAAFSTSSCDEEQLEISNNNTVSASEFFQTEADFRSAVNGTIHPITAVFFWGRVIHTSAMLRSDAFNIVPFAQNTVMSTMQGQPGTRWAADMYPQLYQTIFRANTVLEAAAENPDALPDGAARDEILGQAYFMRAFANWYLAYFWGNAPLVLETPESTEDFFPSQASQDEIAASILSDLSMAAAMLPVSWPAVDLGRPTSGAALALRGKTNLYQNDFASAAADFRAVVESGAYSLLPAAQYLENFTTTNENNSESVFELQFLEQANFIWGSDIPGTGTQANFIIDYAVPNVALDNGHFINPHIFDAFESNADIVRRNATIAFDYPGATGYGGLPFLEDFTIVDTPDSPETDDLENAANFGVQPYFTRKYSGMNAGILRENVNGFGVNIGNNWRIIRYADVLLMLAEAENELGNSGVAVGLINQVRQRAEIADLTAGLSQDQVFDAVVEERIMELTGEGHRFLDLVRWELAEEVMGQGSTISGGEHPKSLAGDTAFFTANQDELIWIPAPELLANPNLTQNPGY